MKSFYLFLVILLGSCKPIQYQDSTDETVQTLENEPKIAFFFFEAIKKSETTFQVNLKKLKISKGKLKGNFQNKIALNKRKENFWLFSFENANKDCFIQIQTPIPLEENIEFINENGNFEHRIIHHDNKEFVIRIPYTTEIENITVEKINKTDAIANTTIINQIHIE